MDLAALIIADSRFPGGGHVHSGGIEEAVVRKLVVSERDLPAFLLSRLRTAGALAATFAAAAAHATTREVRSGHWRRLDAEFDARTPSQAQRAASRAQGRGTARAGRVAWPSPALSDLLGECPRPHHPIVLGVLVGVPHDAAMAAAYLAVSGPASAAVRLLGLDPFQVNAVVARLAEPMREVCAHAADVAGHDPATLPAPSSPGLDLFAEAHAAQHEEEVRLFAS
ncbi:urease accessory protein UreF [Labedaea rhizosphaerae]|uniref:Urease accessory protein n=1 Tax=Labedaea rhizosphaerae TaxID=598644 RepID=A0A4R6S944_LABRH|nr:urease accessory UreF family protein [Labedaea rhizosphaerae]TDP96432.1 urease accessory protein [Labedaea rhizosphaerae]